MKNRTKTALAGGLLTLTLAGLSYGVAKAGAYSTLGQLVWDQGGMAGPYGIPRRVRASPDQSQYLTCQIVAIVPDPAWVMCIARDAYGKQQVCYSSTPEHVELVQSMGPDDAIAFENWPDGLFGHSGSDCHTIKLWKSSLFLDGYVPPPSVVQPQPEIPAIKGLR